MAKNYVCSAWYLRNHASHDCHCRAEEENNIISWHFFYFFKILTFWVVKRVRGQKMAHKMAYTIWSCFLLHKFNIMTSPDAFFIFSKFWFSGLLGVKNDPKWLKTFVSLCISGTLAHMILVFDISSFFFSRSQNSDFFGFSKFNNKCQKEILRCVPPSHVCNFFSKTMFWLFFSDHSVSFAYLGL